jgi:hypothetical protein
VDKARVSAEGHEDPVVFHTVNLRVKALADLERLTLSSEARDRLFDRLLYKASDRREPNKCIIELLTRCQQQLLSLKSSAA